LDTSATHILEQLATEIDALGKQLGRRLVLIAESDLNDPRVVRPAKLGGYGIGAQWSDDFHHSLHSVLTGETTGYYADFGSWGQLCKALRQAFVYDGCYSRFRGRRHGRSPAGLDGDHFLGYMQNHDQIGNRAKGERSSQLMSSGRLRIAAALVLTSPFVPMLFQGEEWGASTPFLYFTGHEEEELGHAVSEGRKQEFVAFGWNPDEIPDPQALDSFTRSKLDWAELGREPHQGLLQWHRELILLRKQNSGLTDGRLSEVQADCDEAARWIRVTRGSVCVGCNLANDTQRIAVKPKAHARLALASDPAVRLESNQLELPPDTAAIVIG
jgi:maltooligosyltrehalose trehalohydrolase